MQKKKQVPKTVSEIMSANSKRRWQNVSKEERSKIGLRMAKDRWKGHVKKS